MWRLGMLLVGLTVVGVVCVGAGLFEGLYMPARGDVVVMVCS